MKTIITRLGFCPACEAANRPFKGLKFLVYGSHHEDYYVREAMRSGIKGFTPHLYILEQVTTDNLCIVSSICCMHGCGVEYRPGKNGYVYGAKPQNWQKLAMPINDWNGLVNFRRDEQYFI